MERAEVDVVNLAVAAQVPEVAHIAAQPDVLREESHHAGASVHPGLVVRKLDHRVADATGDLRSHEPGPDRDVRTHAFAMRAAHRYADDEVAHDVHDVVGAERAFVAEEARRVAEVELRTDDAGAHRAGVDAEVRAPVTGVVSEVRPDEGADPTVRTRGRRGADERDRRAQENDLDDTSHETNTP